MASVVHNVADDKYIAKPKRSHGQGAIRERNGKFLAEVMVDGKRLYHTAATKRDANKWIRDTVGKAEAGLLPADGGKTTLAQFLARWMAAKKTSIKPKTADLYEYTIRCHILPTLGDVKVSGLTGDQLQALYADKLSAGLSARTVEIMHRLLHGALAYAVKYNLAPRNVADAVIPPKPARRAMTVWTAEQASAFLSATADDRLHAPYAVLIYGGLRLGELLGLRWSDIDLVAGRLHVQRTLQRLKHGQGLVVGEPKSSHGRRQIALPSVVVDVLKRWRIRQKEERLLAGERWVDTGYVFTTSVGTPMEQSNFNHYFDRTATRLGLPPIRVHDLRHTCATMLLSQGVHPKVVQEMLGHSQISLTMDTYSHVLPTMQDEAARTLERVLRGR
jgi:integrase